MHIARPAVSEKRLSLLSNGHVRYELKTPYRDGTTHVIFKPMDLIARLVALVPKPRVNLTCFHGISLPTARIVRRLRRPSAARATRRTRKAALGR